VTWPQAQRPRHGFELPRASASASALPPDIAGPTDRARTDLEEPPFIDVIEERATLRELHGVLADAALSAVTAMPLSSLRFASWSGECISLPSYWLPCWRGARWLARGYQPSR
jgi:hypothetical protein